jgi:protein gp37
VADGSAIEWTGATWNPVTGCTRVSPGCAHCYIERTPPFRIAGRRFERVGNEETTGVRLHPERLDSKHPLYPASLRNGEGKREGPIFVCSLSDLFHEEVPDDFIVEVFAVMGLTPERTFQVLTKRPERALEWFGPPPTLRERNRTMVVRQWPLPNVWIGVSIENARYTYRADVLRQIPAAVRFVSAEPLLGSLIECPGNARPGAGPVGPDAGPSPNARHPLDLTGVDWLIVGGESGPGARPMRVEWARELRDACLDQCIACRAGWEAAVGYHRRGVASGLCGRTTAFFFKQWGGKTAKAGGRLLDGRTWDELPRAA